MSLSIESFCLGPLQNNAYVVWDKDGDEAFVVDPPLGSELIAAFAKREGLRITKVLNTHCHFDHIGGNAFLCGLFGAKLLISEKELGLLVKGPAHAGYFGLDMDPSPEPAGFLKDGDGIILGGSVVKVIETPGHTPGGLCFFSGPALFSGDTLFAGSIGRTDLEGGDFDAIIDSIRRKLFTLPPGTAVYPGHGPATTISREIGMNPYAGEGAETGGGID